MECLQLRSPPGPFHYLISEQAKSFVALQELQNEVGALLEFRDLVIETFPNLRSKMPPSTPASGARRDWEPGVRVRRKLAGGGGDSTRAKPQPSVQDSGFSTETSCGKDAHSSSASASASATRSRPLEDELWALLDVIQRKGVRLRDEAELLRGELDERHSADTAEESFARALSASGGCSECADFQRLRCERDALLARAAALEAEVARSPPAEASTPLGRLDSALETPSRPPRVATPDSKKFAAILLESNPVELQRQLLTSTVQNQVLIDRLKRAAARRTLLLERLERARDLNEDLKFRLEEKSIELEGARALVRKLEGGGRPHSSMRDMEPLALPSGARSHSSERLSETPRRRPSRIPLHTANKGAAPRPPRSPAPSAPPRPSSGASSRSRKEPKSGVPVRRSPPADKRGPYSAETERDRDRSRETERERDRSRETEAAALRESLKETRGSQAWHARARLVAEYLARTQRLAPRLRPLPPPARLAYAPPDNLATELTRSMLDSLASQPETDSLWNGKPQQYFESVRAGATGADSDELA